MLNCNLYPSVQLLASYLGWIGAWKPRTLSAADVCGAIRRRSCTQERRARERIVEQVCRREWKEAVAAVPLPHSLYMSSETQSSHRNMLKQ